MLSQIEIEHEHSHRGLGMLVYAFLDTPYSMSSTEARERLANQAQKLKDEPWAQDLASDPLGFISLLYDAGIVGVESTGGFRWFRRDRAFSEIAQALSGEFTVVVHPAFHRYLRSLGT